MRGLLSTLEINVSKLFEDIIYFLIACFFLGFFFAKFIVPGQGYLFYIPNIVEFSLLNFTISVVIGLAYLFFLNTTFGQKVPFLSNFLRLMGIFLLAPSLVFFVFGATNIVHSLYILIGLFCLYIVSNFIAQFDVKPVNSKLIRKYYIRFLVALVIYTLVSLMQNFSLSSNFLDYYGQRETYTQLNTPFIGYLTPWMTNVIVPLMLVIGFSKKKKYLVAISFLVSILIFFLAGFRSVLGIYFLTLIMCLLYRTNTFFLINIFFTFALLIIFILGDSLTRDIFLSLFRRAFFAPIGIHEVYFNIFSYGNFVYGEGSFYDLSSNFNSADPQRIVTPIVAGSESGLNVGWIGDSFAHFGLKGIIIYSSFLGIFFGLMENMYRNIFGEKTQYCAVIVGLFLVLLNSSLNVVLLTHGMIFMFITFYFLQKNNV